MKENESGHNQQHNQQFVIRVPKEQGQFYVRAPGDISREEIFRKLRLLYPSRTRPEHPYPINETVVLEKSDFISSMEGLVREGRKPGVPKGTKRKPDSALTPEELERRNKAREKVQRRKLQRKD